MTRVLRAGDPGWRGQPGWSGIWECSRCGRVVELSAPQDELTDIGDWHPMTCATPLHVGGWLMRLFGPGVERVLYVTCPDCCPLPRWPRRYRSTVTYRRSCDPTLEVGG